MVSSGWAAISGPSSGTEPSHPGICALQRARVLTVRRAQHRGSTTPSGHRITTICPAAGVPIGATRLNLLKTTSRRFSRVNLRCSRLPVTNFHGLPDPRRKVRPPAARQLLIVQGAPLNWLWPDHSGGHPPASHRPGAGDPRIGSLPGGLASNPRPAVRRYAARPADLELWTWQIDWTTQTLLVAPPAFIRRFSQTCACRRPDSREQASDGVWPAEQMSPKVVQGVALGRFE